MAVAARDEDDARPLSHLDAGQRVGEIGDQDSIRARKPRPRRECGAVVEDGHPEVQHVPDESEGLGDVARADNEELGLRLPALHVELGAVHERVTAWVRRGLEQGARFGARRGRSEIAVVARPVPGEPTSHEEGIAGFDDDSRHRLSAVGDLASDDGQGGGHVEAAAHDPTSRR